MEVYVGVDVGGTFTDFAVVVPSQSRRLLYKVPSTPGEPHRAITEGLSAILREFDLDASSIVRLSHGTTVGTNALIQRKVGRIALVTTSGFRDLIEIGRQVRPKVYDMHLDFPPPLVPREHRFEVTERMRADGEVIRPLDENEVRKIAESIVAAKTDCVVVCFLHAYAYPAHEQRAAEILREVLPADIFVLTSTSVYPEFREYERFSTAVLNGALMTVMDRYLDRLTSDVARIGIRQQPKISQSSGGLMSVDMARRTPVRASLSGPAAGVLATVERAKAISLPNVITLDVGGTSTDVSLIKDGAPTVVSVQTIEGFPVRMPALDVTAVGAGGGSIAWIDMDELLKVGSMSAGADPGPACYGRGGTEATVTDANVLLGRLSGTALLDGRMPIEKSLAETAVKRLALSLGLDVMETALGIVRVSAATIVKAIRRVSVERGHDPRDFTLFAFGGAGPVCAVDVAHEMGIRTIVVPPNPGILCAEGLQACDLTIDFVHSALFPLDTAAIEAANATRAELVARADHWFTSESVPLAARQRIWTADLRYIGQNFELSVPVADAPFVEADIAEMRRAFRAAHDNAYGFAAESEPIEIVNLKLKAIGILDKPSLPKVSEKSPSSPVGQRAVIFREAKPVATPIYRRAELAPAQSISGPALVEQLDTTILIYPGDTASVDAFGNLVIRLR